MNEAGPYENLEAINQLKEICAINDELAVNLLRNADWNIDTAVRHFFEGGNLLEDDSEYSEGDEPEEINDNVFQENPTNQHSNRPDSFIGWLTSLISIPVRLIIWSLRDLFGFFYNVFGGVPLSVADPRDEIQSFVTEFQEKHDRDKTLPWLNMPYNNAVSEARKQIRYLVVYLHNPSSSSSDAFSRDYLMSPRFIEFLAQNDCLLWGASIRTSEGYKVAYSVRDHNSPCLALFCYYEGRTACLIRLSGQFSLDSMLDSLEACANLNRHHLTAQEREKREREFNNQLRREQEDEYQRSLAADRAKVQERKRIESERIEADRMEEELRLQQEKRTLALLSKRREIKDSMPPEPEANSNVVTVGVKFPEGSKLQRKFYVDDSLELLFNAVSIHETCPHDFTLLTSYPRHVLKCAPEWYKDYTQCYESVDQIPTFRGAGLEGSVIVLVRDNDA